MSRDGPVVFDGSVLGDGPWTGVALAFLTTLEAYARIAERELVLVVPPTTPRLDAGLARRIDLDARGIARHVPMTGTDHGWVRIRLDGGCQGCALAEVTLRQGIEPLLRARLPAFTGLIDVTDHEAGTSPFFSPEKR